MGRAYGGSTAPGGGAYSGGVTAGGTTSDGGSETGGEGGIAVGGTMAGGAGGEGGGSLLVDPCADEAALTVVTFNIRYDGGNPSDPNAWSHATAPRRERVVALTEAMSPDLMGVQEALANQVNDLTAALPGYGFVGVGRDDGAEAGEYAGVFYRSERLELLDHGHFWLSTTPNVPGTVFDGSGSIRMATWVIVRDRLTAREIFLLNTHWDNVSWESREASAALIREQLATLPSGRPKVLTGDLNQAESSTEVQTLLSPEPFATALIDGYRQVYPTPRANERTYHAFTGTTEGQRIDYVLHDAQLVAIDAAIRHDSFDGLYPSDHYPVVGTLGWALDDAGQACP